jgi:hypothetical protein
MIKEMIKPWVEDIKIIHAVTILLGQKAMY